MFALTFALVGAVPLLQNRPDNRRLSRLLNRIEQARLQLYAAESAPERLLYSQKLDILINRYHRLAARLKT